MRVVILDSVCPKPYSRKTLETEALGGTEATVIRISEGLAKEGLDVTVMQRGRESAINELGVKYHPIDQNLVNIDHLIVLRDPVTLYQAQRIWRKPKMYFWVHDLYTQMPGSDEYYDYCEPRTTLITVSDFHKTQVVEKLKAFGVSTPFPRVKRIYNPIDNELNVNNEAYDNNKLVFFSSPHKGLNNVIRIFNMLRTQHPDFRLYIANPGYMPDSDNLPDGVINVGKLSHKEALEHVRSSLCVFYPNCIFPETFGLVFAEANAVGTPVLAHSFGAAREVLGNDSQVLDCRNDENVIKRLLAWHGNNRPVVKAKEEFRLKNVVSDWLKLLNY